MKYKLIFYLTILQITNSYTQVNCKISIDELSGYKITEVVDSEPYFSKKQSSVKFANYILTQIKKQAIEITSYTIEIEYIIDTKGKIIFSRFYNKKEKSLTSFEKSVLSIINRSKKWIPARCNNKNVCFLMYQKIYFTPSE